MNAVFRPATRAVRYCVRIVSMFGISRATPQPKKVRVFRPDGKATRQSGGENRLLVPIGDASSFRTSVSKYRRWEGDFAIAIERHPYGPPRGGRAPFPATPIQKHLEHPMLLVTPTQTVRDTRGRSARGIRRRYAYKWSPSEHEKSPRTNRRQPSSCHPAYDQQPLPQCFSNAAKSR